MEDEIFGPILPILTYKSFDEAMMRMAKTGRPLAGFIFSRDQKTIDRFIGQLSFGGGDVNLINVHLFVETMPFGGTGSAGIGHYYGKFGFDALTHAKSMLISPPDVAIEHLYSPFIEEKNRQLARWFEYRGAHGAGFRLCGMEKAMTLARVESVAGVKIPDTALCTAAVDLLQSCSPAFLCSHCLRT
jgi:delta 1-pyrroline-5-carboxylate dehydrogenase